MNIVSPIAYRISCIPHNQHIPLSITSEDCQRWESLAEFQRKAHNYQVAYQSRYLDPLYVEYWITEELLKIKNVSGRPIYTLIDIQTAVIKISQMMPNDWRRIWLVAADTVRAARGLAPGKLVVMIPLDNNYRYSGYFKS